MVSVNAAINLQLSHWEMMRCKVMMSNGIKTIEGCIKLAPLSSV